MSFALAELNRRFENLIRVGTIAVVDEQQKRLRVKSGDLITNWLPWPAHIGNNFIQWRPLRLNTQVVLCCPSGDPAQAMIIGMLYSDTQSSPDQDPAVDRIQFEDGTVVQYNANQKTLTLSSASNIKLVAAENIELQAKHINSTAQQHNISGTVEQTGGDITSDGISVQTHKHGAVKAGTAKTAVPE